MSTLEITVTVLFVVVVLGGIYFLTHKASVEAKFASLEKELDALWSKDTTAVKTEVASVEKTVSTDVKKI